MIIVFDRFIETLKLNICLFHDPKQNIVFDYLP